MYIQPDAFKLKAALGQVCNAIHSPGVIAGVAIDGETPMIVANGLGDAALQQKLLPIDRLRVGSLTKTFTAVAILQLVEAGILHLKDPVSRWVPAIPYGNMITVEHLLRHTSGLFNYTDSQDFFSAVQTAPGILKIWEPQELVAFATKENHVFSPGQGWAYSNTNYILLGIILKAATQKSLASIYRQNIFAPLNMADTFLDAEETIPGGFIPGFASSPENPSQFSDMTNLMHVSSAWAAGGIISTVKDLLLFNRALFSGQLLKDTILAQMKDYIVATDPIYSMVSAYGLGLVSMKINGKTVYGHIGNIPGYSSLMGFLPEDKVYLIVLMNQNYTRLENNKTNVEVMTEKIIEVLSECQDNSR
ncbi:MAG TPA: hypothetical protein DCG47_10755 [Spirochaetaceae bacterium]|jgi:D-alanyl-D-alanine carboxypeptidase|nr:hypothetical protein [Spirochaetaceae bacterium]